jgi:hypothetical protein
LALHAAVVVAITAVIAPLPSAGELAEGSAVELGIVDLPGARTPRAPEPPAPPPVDVAPSPLREDQPPEGSQPSPAEDKSPFGDGLSAVGGDTNFGLGAGGPRGTMIALQADLDVLRTSSLAPEAGTLLELVPGLGRLLSGSGLDPVADFRRVLVATPDFGFARLVASARVRSVGSNGAREALSRAAQSANRGALAWDRNMGLPVAPWPIRDTTPRIVALVEHDQIAITARDDLERLLRVAAALSGRNQGQATMDRAQGATALLAMYEGEALALSIEGARAFVTGATHAVPVSLRLSLRGLDEFHTDVRAIGLYESPAEAKRALAHAEWLRRAWGAQSRAMGLGLQGAVEQAEITQQGNRVELRGSVTLHQMRFLLALLGQVLRPGGLAALAPGAP